LPERSERTISVSGHDCRVWEQGKGKPLGYLAGLKGCPRWTPFLERLASKRRVIVPSLLGYPGSDGGHRELDDLADWVTMTLDLLAAAGLEGEDLVGSSVGGTLLAEAAAFSPASARRLALIAPFGIYDQAEPVTLLYAHTPAEQGALLCENLAAYEELTKPPHPEDAEATLEWEMALFRANEASARLLWPFGDRGLRKRLHRIVCPTLLVWGKGDRLVPPSYAARFAEGIRGKTRVELIDGAGHLADLDAPDAVADAVLGFLNQK
jgi:pimeloyl-ACP methyl ester carboxylesterase